MKITASLAALAAAIIGLSGCGSTSDVPVYTSEYTAIGDVGGGQFDAFVDFDDPDKLEAVFTDILDKDDRADGDGGYWVLIRCEGVSKDGPSLAIGKWAVGGLGVAQTGLEEGAHEFEVNEGAQCGPEDQPAAEAECTGTVNIDEQLSEVVTSVALPDGAKVMAGRVTTDSDNPGMVGVALDLCGLPINSVEDLRPVATDFAQAVEASPLGETTVAMWVANFHTYTKAGLGGEEKVKVDDFQIFTWADESDTVLVSPDTNWKVCPGGTCY